MHLHVSSCMYRNCILSKCFILTFFVANNISFQKRQSTKTKLLKPYIDNKMHKLDDIDVVQA